MPPAVARCGLQALQCLDGAAPVEHARQRVDDCRALGSAQPVGQRLGLTCGRCKLAFQPSVGCLHRCSRGAKLREERGETGGIERRRQSGAAIGNGTAIIGKIGATAFEVVRQRFRLVVRGRDQCRPVIGADVTAMGAAQIADARSSLPAVMARSTASDRRWFSSRI